MKRAQIKPLVLEAKEAVSLINGTQAMLAIGTLVLLAAETLVDTADVIGAMACDALKGTNVAFDERIQKARPMPDRSKRAANLRRLLEGSEIRESHRDCGRVQDAYSLRCIPQVHGAVRDTLAHCRAVFETETNSAVDNPLVFVKNPKAMDGEGDVISGRKLSRRAAGVRARFSGDCAQRAGWHQRAADGAHGESRAQRGIAAISAPGAGMNSGFMMPQVTAAALVSENKVLAHPASVDSITTSGNKEDYVSMGMTAANKLRKVVENTRNMLAIEAMAAAQALDFLAPLKTSKRVQRRTRRSGRSVPRWSMTGSCTAISRASPTCLPAAKLPRRCVRLPTKHFHNEDAYRIFEIPYQDTSRVRAYHAAGRADCQQERRARRHGPGFGHAHHRQAFMSTTTKAA